MRARSQLHTVIWFVIFPLFTEFTVYKGTTSSYPPMTLVWLVFGNSAKMTGWHTFNRSKGMSSSGAGRVAPYGSNRVQVLLYCCLNLELSFVLCICSCQASKFPERVTTVCVCPETPVVTHYLPVWFGWPVLWQDKGLCSQVSDANRQLLNTGLLFCTWSSGD